MDSLYKGFPVGCVIAWRNPNVRLKDGTLSEGKKILIDGQQRMNLSREVRKVEHSNTTTARLPEAQWQGYADNARRFSTG